MAFNSEPTFDEEYVLFNVYAPVNENFIDFLEENNGQIVVIKTLFDFSPAMSIHNQTLFDCNNAYPKPGMSKEEFLAQGGSYELLDGKIFNRDIQLPHIFVRWRGEVKVNIEGCASDLYIRIISSKTKAQSTFGGTGIVFHRINGRFDVHIEYASSTRRIILTELPLL
jgi:hypothetical protein